MAAATASGGGDGARVCEGESRGRGGGRGRVRERSGWLRGVSGASRRGGERAGRQRGRWRGAAERARVGHAPVLLSGRKTTEEGQWAGPALAAGPARPHRSWAAGKSPSLFLFYFSDICFDLVIILNQFISLCQFLQELTILFQSSFINGIIFGQYFIYITIYIQSKYLCLNSKCPK